MPLSSAPAPIDPSLPPTASLNAEAARGPSAGAGAPPLGGRDALFATLARQSPPDGTTPAADAVFAALAQQLLSPGVPVHGPRVTIVQ
jgi:hypothetical protein